MRWTKSAGAFQPSPKLLLSARGRNRYGASIFTVSELAAIHVNVNATVKDGGTDTGAQKPVE